MARTEPANDGETLDALVWRTTGRGSAAIAQVLAANPGLAAQARVMPAGLEVTIPDAALAPPTAPLLQLWD